MSPRPFWLSSLCCLLLPAAVLAGSDAPREKVILDQDAFGPASSNLQGLLMFIQSPRTEVLGITVVSGDGWRDENVAHTLRLLEVIGRTDIPVVPGATNPLINSLEATKRWESLYGKLVYKGCWTETWPHTGVNVKRTAFHAANVVPPLLEGDPATKPAPEIAANFLLRKVHEFPGQVTIYAAGPLTDLALAIRLDPEFSSLVKELVIMGGSFEPIPNASPFSLEYVNSPRLEFNFHWDPEAAHIVFHSPWKKIVQVPVDPTTTTALTPEMIVDIAKIKTPLTEYLMKYAEAGYPLWDELAAAVWLDPTIITQSKQVLEDVDLSFTAGYGNTLSWDADHAPGLGEQSVTIVQAVDVPKLEKMFVELMQAPTPGAAASAEVKEPTAKREQDTPWPGSECILNIASDGRVVLDRQTLSLEQLQDKLKQLSDIHPDQAVIVRGDDRVDYARVVDVLDICRAANIWNVAFATSKAAPR